MPHIAKLCIQNSYIQDNYFMNSKQTIFHSYGKLELPVRKIINSIIITFIFWAPSWNMTSYLISLRRQRNIGIL
jgi:hypothetical protein